MASSRARAFTLGALLMILASPINAESSVKQLGEEGAMERVQIPTPRTAYATDFEGSWTRLSSFVNLSDLVSFNAKGELDLAPDAHFVFGGDVPDRGPAKERVTRSLVNVKKRYSDRVCLLLGNRDINKLHLYSVIKSHSDPVTHLKAMFSTINAAGAFEYIRQELSLDSKELISDEAVVSDFLADLEPGGASYEYLMLAQLAAVIGDTLYVHGSISEFNIGRIPNHSVIIEDVREWAKELNAFSKKEITEWAQNPQGKVWNALLSYASPTPGARENIESVVYSRFSGADGNPSLPPIALMQKLLKQGIRRVVVGHTPSGSVPIILRWGEFTVVLADTSYREDEKSSAIEISVEGTRIRSELENGKRVDFNINDASLVDAAGLPISILGYRNTEKYLVKAPIEKEAALLYRMLPKYQVEEIIVPTAQLKFESFQPPNAPVDCSVLLKE